MQREIIHYGTENMCTSCGLSRVIWVCITEIDIVQWVFQ
jgi:hypothetical protein